MSLPRKVVVGYWGDSDVRRDIGNWACVAVVASAGQMIDWAEMAGVEAVLINEDNKPPAFRQELRWSDVAWKLR